MCMKKVENQKFGQKRQKQLQINKRDRIGVKLI